MNPGMALAGGILSGSHSSEQALNAAESDHAVLGCDQSLLFEVDNWDRFLIDRRARVTTVNAISPIALGQSGWHGLTSFRNPPELAKAISPPFPVPCSESGDRGRYTRPVESRRCA
jgi:hypothetical protein